MEAVAVSKNQHMRCIADMPTAKFNSNYKPQSYSSVTPHYEKWGSADPPDHRIAASENSLILTGRSGRFPALVCPALVCIIFITFKDIKM